MKPFLITLLILTMLTGCKETHCPGFPEYLQDYLPYSEGDVLLFTNANSDTLSLEITLSWASDSYSYKWNEKFAGGAGAGFKTALNDFFLLKIEGVIILSPDPRSEITIDFYNNSDFSLIFDDVDPFKKENESLFGDTLTMENECSGETRISEIKIVKGKGIVYFTDKQKECTWELIE